MALHLHQHLNPGINCATRFKHATSDLILFVGDITEENFTPHAAISSTPMNTALAMTLGDRSPNTFDDAKEASDFYDKHQLWWTKAIAPIGVDNMENISISLLMGFVSCVLIELMQRVKEMYVIDIPDTGERTFRC
jgi:hypothetical protein